MTLTGSCKSRSHVWEVRHAGLLEIKYEVAVRCDLVEKAELEDSKDILRGVEAAVFGCVVFTIARLVLTPDVSAWGIMTTTFEQ